MFWQGKTTEAYDLLKKAKQIDRENAKHGTREVFLTPEAVMGQLCEQFEGPKSTTGNAEKWFKTAVENAPDDLATRQVVAFWALAKGKIAFAKQQADAVLKIEASDAQRSGGSNVGHKLGGLVAVWQKDWPAAEKHFQAVILDSPNDFAAKNNLALVLVEQHDPAKKQRALDYAEANYRVDKNNPNALSTLGWVYFRRSQFDLAKLALDQAVTAAGGKMDPDTATYMAHVLDHQDQKWQAKETLAPILKDERPFSMRPEAEKLYEKVKDAVKP